MTNLVTSDLMDSFETARLIKLKNANTLAVWRSTKRYALPYVKVGRKVLYRRSDVEEFLRLRTMPGIPEVTPRKRRSKKRAA